jgi:hypothetical protein
MKRVTISSSSLGLQALDSLDLSRTGGGQRLRYIETEAGICEMAAEIRVAMKTTQKKEKK